MRLLFDIITVAGFLLTALGTYLTVMSGEQAEEIVRPLVIACIALTLVFATLWYHSFHKSMLLKSVFHGGNHISEALNMIVDLNHSPKRKSHVQQGIVALSEICQEVSAGLRKYHSPDIAICIHYVNSDNEGAYVNTLCRNTESKKRPAKRAVTAKSVDYIKDNSDFDRVVNLFKRKPLDKVYYLNNFLPFSPYYRNSHFSSEMQPVYYRSFGWAHRIFRWELPYRSTLVVPLVTTISPKEKRVEGFLSIDSPKCWSFSRDYDLPIVQRFAAAIAPLVAAYNNSNLLDR